MRGEGEVEALLERAQLESKRADDLAEQLQRELKRGLEWDTRLAELASQIKTAVEAEAASKAAPPAASSDLQQANDATLKAQSERDGFARRVATLEAELNQLRSSSNHRIAALEAELKAAREESRRQIAALEADLKKARANPTSATPLQTKSVPAAEKPASIVEKPSSGSSEKTTIEKTTVEKPANEKTAAAVVVEKEKPLEKEKPGPVLEKVTAEKAVEKSADAGSASEPAVKDFAEQQMGAVRKEDEQKVRRAVAEWVERLTGTKLPEDSNWHEALKDGVVLCSLANALRPGSCKKINRGKMAFLLMENINQFLVACEALGLPAFDRFDTPTLWNGSDMRRVLQCLVALARLHGESLE